MPTMRVSEHPEFDPDFSLDFPHWDQVVDDGIRALAPAALAEARLAAALTRKPGGESDWMKGVAAGLHRILNVIADPIFQGDIHEFTAFRAFIAFLTSK
jgi:hypothetical protein